MVYATDSLNFKKGEGGCEHTMYPRQNEPGSGWDSSDAPNSWYGAGALLLNGPNNSVTLGATSATNILPAPYGPYVPGKNNEDGKKPNIWYSLNGHLRAVGLPEIKAKEPKKPVPPTEPVEPVKPESTIHYHYAVTYVKPDVQKAVTAADGTDLQGRTVEVGSRVDYTLNVATIPANHETFESIVFNDNLPDGYEIDLEETKQGSADYEVEYDSSSRHIKFTAKSSLLASINADTTTTADIPAPKIIGKVTKAGTKYDNTFKLSLDNVYTVESKPVTVYTPTQPKKDVFTGTDTTSIDGKAVVAGQELTYKIKYINTTGAEQEVTITDVIPAHTSYVESSATDNGVYTSADTKLTWTKKVANGTVWTVTFKVKVNDDVSGEVIKNVGRTKDGVNEVDTNTTTNPTPTQPKKDVFKQGDTTTSIDGRSVKAGDILTYQITYTNTTGETRDVEITDEIPEYTEYVFRSATENGIYDGTKRTITWTKTLSDQETWTVQFDVKISGDINGQVVENTTDVQDGLNQYTTNTTRNPTPTKPKKDVHEKGKTDISIDGQKVNAGQEITYSISYTNTTDAMLDVEVKDVIPAYTTYVPSSANLNGTYNPATNTVSWKKENLAVGEKVTFTFNVKINEDVDEVIIENKAIVKDGFGEWETNKTKNPTIPQRINPKTSDSTHIFMYMGVLIVSVLFGMVAYHTKSVYR